MTGGIRSYFLFLAILGDHMLGRLLTYCRLYVERRKAAILFLDTAGLFPTCVPAGNDAGIHKQRVLDSAPNAIYFRRILRTQTRRSAIDGYRRTVCDEQHGANSTT